MSIMRRPRRSVRAAVLVALASAVLVASIITVIVANRDEYATSAVPFYLDGWTDAPPLADLDRFRRAHVLRITVSGGDCVNHDEPPVTERLNQIRIREDRTTVRVSVLMEKYTGFCAGVGVDFPATLNLPAPLGPRALIADHGPYNFRFVLVPPPSRAVARDLVLPIRRDRRKPPPVIYTGPACDAVALYLRDVPRDEWCSDG